MDICIDFDGTCVTHSYPYVGEEIGSVPILKRIVENGHNLILFTMRSGPQLRHAVDWFKDNEIPLYGIQFNPTQESWTSSPKAYGHLYIDDASIGCPLKESDLSDRPFVDWEAVAWILEKNDII